MFFVRLYFMWQMSSQDSKNVADFTCSLWKFFFTFSEIRGLSWTAGVIFQIEKMTDSGRLLRTFYLFEKNSTSCLRLCSSGVQRHRLRHQVVDANQRRAAVRWNCCHRGKFTGSQFALVTVVYVCQVASILSYDNILSKVKGEKRFPTYIAQQATYAAIGALCVTVKAVFQSTP